MDLDTIDPRGIDVAHEVDKLSFRFYSEKEALCLSVRRLISPHAFDEMGRPIPRGLYDPALGPASYADDPCPTCGLGYNTCPGHFGHIELPVPIPNPLLMKEILKIMRASCWRCPCLRISPNDLNLHLARLYFEDAGMPKCGFAVDAFLGLRQRFSPKNEVSAAENADKEMLKGDLVKNWRAFLRSLPPPLARYLHHVGSNDVDLVERNILQAARVAWKRANATGRLAQHRSPGWKATRDTILGARTKCPKCFHTGAGIRPGDRGRLFRKETSVEVILSPTEIESHIASLWKIHSEVFDLLFGLKGRCLTSDDDTPAHRRLFVRVVLVPPSRFRPTSVVGNMTYAAEHPQNMFFQRLLKEIEIIMTASEHGLEQDGSAEDSSETDGPLIARPSKARFAQAMSNMQEALRDLYDSSGVSARSGRVQMTGIRQQLEAKAGLFRQHMMGKRVNYSCRSVIGPDVFLDTNEIGIPESFAKLLTIPEPVTPVNLKQMQSALLNGPDVYPGAVAVEDWTTGGSHRIIKFRTSREKWRLVAQAGLLMQNRIAKGTGKQTNLQGSQIDSESMGVADANDVASAVPKRVHRHLKTGDVVLFNRQPTLHRVSIMAHKVRVLSGDRTLRFHYANCGSYNADFDGDEMNVHVPQDYLARAEAEELLMCSKHYIVPTSGAPIRGLIQDHIAAATLMSRRDTFMDKEEFMQLLYGATEKLMSRPERAGSKYSIPEPAVYRPQRLWTGKQLISTVLLVVRNGRPGVSLDSRTTTKANVIGTEETHVVFRDGHLLQGIIDKSSLGAAMYGIVHAVQEAYGCDASDDFLSAMSRLCVFFMRSHGHTTGVDDLLLQEKGESQRRRILTKCIQQVGVDVTNSVYAEMSKGDTQRTVVAKSLSEARLLVEDMIRRDGREAEDRLDSTMKSALNKVSSEVMKACVPAALKKAFPKNGFALMTNTGAKGAAVNSAQISCLLGSTVLEGKRVPRMGGSGATLPCFAPFDASPNAGGFISGRFLTGISPQEFFFHAMSGREGLLDTSLKTANSGYLQRCLVKHLEGVRLHYDYTVRDSDQSVLQFIYGDDGIDPSKSRWLNERIEWQIANEKCLKNSGDGLNGISESVHARDRPTTVSSTSGTLLEQLSPGALSHRGAISESFNDAVEKMVKHANEIDSKTVRSFLEGRYQAATVEPGEAVGVLAAQGVGEPSTQMTLNTFHHAGSSSAHVTLGIPRLRELLMTASKYPKTPSMTLPIRAKHPQTAAKRLCRRLQNIRLLDLLVQVEVREKGICLAPGQCEWAIRNVQLVLQFPPEDVYRKQIGISFTSIRKFVGDHFLPEFHNLVRREVQRVSSNFVKNKDPALSIYSRVAQEPNHAQHSSDQELEVNLDEPDGPSFPLNEASKTDGNETDDVSDPGLASSSDEEGEEDDDEDNDEERDSRKHAKALMKEQAEDGSDESVEKEKRKKSPTPKSRNMPGKRSVEVGTDVEGVYDKAIFGQLGYVSGSFQSLDKQTVASRWGFPVALCGMLDIAGIAREAAHGLKLAEVPRISKCFIDANLKGCSVITEGSNIPAVVEKGEGLVDFNRLETNDMFGILDRYGVEALRSALIQEFVKVFDVYGIPVNIRHLRLIADYMTMEGSYRGFNRLSMHSTPSPFQRMTFETSIAFLTDSTINGTEDHMKNPSAVIALGQVYEGGTGGFQLMQKVN